MTTESNRFRPLGFLIVTALGGALAVLLALRPLPDAAAAEDADAAGDAAEGEPGKTDATTAENGEPDEVGKAEAKPDGAEAKPAEPIEPERPLRVVGLGWEIVAPGLLANDGLVAGESSDFEAAGLAVEFAVAASADELEARLARGGAVDNGADVALVPLPTFVASYEQLRALSPEVFFVVGWSHGRDALAADDPELLAKPTKAGKGELALVGSPGQPATLLSLFALDEAGHDAAAIELISPTSNEAKDVKLRAIERSLDSPLGATVDARDLILTSADAPRLIPMVAVAPASFVRSNTNDLARFGRVWLGGVERFGANVPDAARRIAQERGAPEAVALLEMMSYVSFSDLADAARIAGLSGRGAVSLEVLFQRSWALWREVGVLSTPAPEHAPLDNTVIARVALGDGAPIVAGREPPRRAGQRLVLVHALPSKTTLDEEALVDEIGFLAGAFERADIELSVRKDKDANRRIVAEAIERYDLDPEHVRVGPRLRGTEVASVRVLVP